MTPSVATTMYRASKCRDWLLGPENMVVRHFINSLTSQWRRDPSTSQHAKVTGRGVN